MIADRFARQLQTRRDHWVGESGCDQVEDLSFPCGQLRQRYACNGFWVDQAGEQTAGDGRANTAPPEATSKIARATSS